MKYKLYEVGGRVRDKLLGLQSKDIDFSVVVEDVVWNESINNTFNRFVKELKSEGYSVFLETPDCFTVRAKFPKWHKFNGSTADFVLARKEMGYIEGTRKPNVVLGTLEDDLIRRDFTVNAIAKDINGNIIDPFNGQKDLRDGILRTPTDTVISFNDDPLRILRAMRFSLTKKLEFSDDIWRTIASYDYSRLRVVSKERIREELYKMFMFDTLATLSLLQTISKVNYMLYLAILPKEIRLEPTMKK